MGCGLLTLSFRVNQLMELFEEDREMAFADTPEEMLDAVLRYKRDDAKRREIAEAGWRKSHEELNERLAARYIEEVAFRRPLPPSLHLADKAVVIVSEAPAQERALAAPPARIGVVLPARETFGLLKSGAIALCARDFAAHSRFRDKITIDRDAECEYPDVRYRRLVDWRRWYLRGAALMSAPSFARRRKRGSPSSRSRIARNSSPRCARVFPEVKLALHLA